MKQTTNRKQLDVVCKIENIRQMIVYIDIMQVMFNVNRSQTRNTTESDVWHCNCINNRFSKCNTLTEFPTKNLMAQNEVNSKLSAIFGISGQCRLPNVQQTLAPTSSSQKIAVIVWLSDHEIHYSD
jgi:hypothetical protein